MHLLPPLSQKAKRTRIAIVLAAAVLWTGAALHTASAADALTTAAATKVSKGILGSLFKRNRSGDSAPVTGASAMARVNRSILGLPLGLLRAVGSGVVKAAGRSVTSHITHY